MPKKRDHALEAMEGFGSGSPLLEWALLNGGREQNYAVRIGLLLIRRAIILVIFSLAESGCFSRFEFRSMDVLPPKPALDA